MSLIGRSILNHRNHLRSSASIIVALLSDQVENQKKLDHSGRALALFQALHHFVTASSFCSTNNNNNNNKSLEYYSKQTVVVAMPLEDTHYKAHDAESYESAFFYARGDYTTRLRDLVVFHLGLDDNDDDDGLVGVAAVGVVVDDDNKDTTPQDVSSPRTAAAAATRRPKKRRLLDLGGGTGNFTRMLLEDRPHLQAIVIDPFLAKVGVRGDDDGINNEPLRFVQAPAEAFLTDQQQQKDDADDGWWKRDYHQVLFKEVVHHLPQDKRCDIFRAIHHGLLDIPTKNKHVAVNSTTTTASTTPQPPPPSLLIITRPQHEIDYPLWDAARNVWAENQPSSQRLAQELREAGFSNVEHTIHVYPCILASLQKWQDMIRNRCWSTFSHFTNDELERACQELAVTEQHRIDAQGRLHFEDRLMFLSAWK
jgi:hypothetical protein